MRGANPSFDGRHAPMRLVSAGRAQSSCTAGPPSPKHGSWLNVAKPFLSMLSVQCLDQRIGSIHSLRAIVAAWDASRTSGKLQRRPRRPAPPRDGGADTSQTDVGTRAHDLAWNAIRWRRPARCARTRGQSRFVFVSIESQNDCFIASSYND
jgi:hypothetical protein